MMKRAIFAAAVVLAAQAAWAKPLALRLPAVSGGGVFTVPAPADIQVPASVPGAPVPAPAAPSAKSASSAPDWSYTPGKLCTPSDPDFKEYRYAEHIPYCNRNVTQQMKQEIAAHYGIPKSDWPKYEFDHLIPLAIGGNSHIENLWPEPRGMNGGSDEKDKLEQDLYNKMAAGTITQAEAVRQIYAFFGVQPQFKGAPAAPVAVAP